MSIQNISALSSFIRQIERLPYIPSKYTLRFVNYFLEMNLEEIDDFFKSLLILRNALVLCDSCCSWKEVNNECLWCSKKRNQDRICVVETWIDAGALEKSGIFDGIYHILGGVINPLEGKTPDHLSADKLIKSIIENEEIEEIIIATNQTPEGNATASYLVRMIEHLVERPVQITQLASGVPVGSLLEYVDRLTIGKALINRR